MTRSGNADFTGNIPDFITLCESRLNYGSDDPEFPSPPLRVRQMEVPNTTIALDTSGSVLLPSDFLQLRTIYMTGSPRVKLTYMTPNQMDAAYGGNVPGPPINYTIQGNQIRMAPIDTTSHTLVIDYYQKIPSLSNSNTNNWLLQAFPGLYLAGTNLEGAVFVRDNPDAEMFARLFGAHVRSLQKQNSAANAGGDALQMMTDCGNP